MSGFRTGDVVSTTGTIVENGGSIASLNIGGFHVTLHTADLILKRPRFAVGESVSVNGYNGVFEVLGASDAWVWLSNPKGAPWSARAIDCKLEDPAADLSASS